mmetsp:Transcript_314/g.880  ORF Transcript_314/g.880 Transcript_314/m.880 type:complete len:249 (-) Transcript_314:1274-2020(-)
MIALSTIASDAFAKRWSSAAISRNLCCRSTSGKRKAETMSSTTILASFVSAACSLARSRSSSRACREATASTASETISARKVSAEALCTRMACVHCASSSARLSSSTCRLPLSSASRLRRVHSACHTIWASERSSLKRTSSLASRSSVCDTSSACSPSIEVPTTFALCSARSNDPSSASCSPSSIPGASARSSWIRSRRRSFPSNIMFCTARPRMSRCSRMTAFSTSSSISGGSVCGVGGRSSGLTTR